MPETLNTEALHAEVNLAAPDPTNRPANGLSKPPGYNLDLFVRGGNGPRLQGGEIRAKWEFPQMGDPNMVP